jgi:hypothetical protein
MDQLQGPTANAGTEEAGWFYNWNWAEQRSLTLLKNYSTATPIEIPAGAPVNPCLRSCLPLDMQGT